MSNLKERREVRVASSAMFSFFLICSTKTLDLGTQNKESNHMMKNRTETTVGSVTTKENAQYVAERWNNPEAGFHAQAVKKDSGYIVRLVING